MGKNGRSDKKPIRKRGRISKRNLKALQLLDKWLKDESGYDEETWPWLKKALERDRLSARRLFND